MSAALEARHEFAMDLAREAGELAATLRRSLGALEAKDPMDYATKADHAVESLIRQRIRDRFGDASAFTFVLYRVVGGAFPGAKDGLRYLAGAVTVAVPIAFLAGQIRGRIFAATRVG